MVFLLQFRLRGRPRPESHEKRRLLRFWFGLGFFSTIGETNIGRCSLIVKGVESTYVGSLLFGVLCPDERLPRPLPTCLPPQ